MNRFVILVICSVILSALCAEEEVPEVRQTAFSFEPTLNPPSSSEKIVAEIELPRKSPRFAAILSGVWPGLGHMYLGDFRTAGELFVASGLGLGGLQSKETMVMSYAVLQNTWMYGIYAAYRDARVYMNDSGHHYKMPTDSFADMSMAPFRLKVLKKPEVWGGVLGFLAVGALIDYFASPSGDVGDVQEEDMRDLREVAFSPIIALPVGVGEEALFRGYLQSQLTETFTPWGGIILSSLSFTAAHIGNAAFLPEKERWRYYTFGLPLIGAFGMYSGWLTYKNHSLQESAAIHTWYDFVVFLAGSLRQSSIKEKKLNVSTRMSF